MSPPKVGAAHELIVAAAFLKLGCEVYRNLAPEGADLIVARGRRFLRVEVTTANRGRNRWMFRSKRRSAFDVLAVVRADEEIAFLRLARGARPERGFRRQVFEPFSPGTWALEAGREAADELSHGHTQVPARQ
jgi:hypothetical protein